jgi:hypothetical protein
VLAPDTNHENDGHKSSEQREESRRERQRSSSDAVITRTFIYLDIGVIRGAEPVGSEVAPL